MEYVGFQRCMTYLSECGLKTSTFISDRHTSIAKHMREKLKEVVHYFDLWHLKKVSLFELQITINFIKMIRYVKLYISIACLFVPFVEVQNVFSAIAK